MISRTAVRALVEHPRFQQVVIAVIVVNAITLGLQTSRSVVAEHGELLDTADQAALAFFVVELSMRFYAYGRDFFRDPWSLFDLVVVAIALVPATGPFAVLRTLRVLRVLRLFTAIPAMRRVVGGLLSSLPGMASIVVLLSLVLYVAGVLATTLFGGVRPDVFGSLDSSLFTLFQVMIGETGMEVARDLMAAEPLAWIFFVVYIVVSSFAVLNLFIGVIVSSVESEFTRDQFAAEEQRDAEEAVVVENILDEIRSLRAEVAALRGIDLPQQVTLPTAPRARE
ncbi:ion transporter [Actinokineospora soli]|uniref:Ion transporter n=1 Tax=Actinokineospora soli TaxID=1048753 RepID=A0ABW2TJC1_9PSEU